MKTTCRYCNKIHDMTYECEKKLKRKHEKKSNYIDKFRWSSVWKKKAKEIKERDGYLCVYSKHHGLYETHDLEVHHIIPLAEDFSKRLDNNNLITLTRLIHEQAEDGTISREELLNLILPPIN